MQKNWLAIFIVIVVLLVGGVYAFKTNLLGFAFGNAQTGGEVACTMEAKLCPDGSSVGRTGPHCEFAACPTATTASGNATLKTSLTQTATGAGLSITPLEVLEDSRCPAGVECIQAGTVRVSAQVAGPAGTAAQTFALNEPEEVGAQTVTLIQVAPLKTEGQQINQADYRFTFVVSKR
ncbi:MAG TPA: hypothetical protein VN701_01710 [Candidatus Paceibacterota bacterium]|nr:hypothetical protein [Candidatus Paceibacterota bacterium]